MAFIPKQQTLSTLDQRSTKVYSFQLGQSDSQFHHIDKWIASLGGLVSLMGILLISHISLGLEGASMLVASMGASAVLLFAAPHAEFSQPWSVLAGHTVSAVVGMSCVHFIEPPLFAAAASVALAIMAMHYLKCIHPPGGATALSAVIGGEAIQSLGYQYVLTPVLINAATILLIAIAFNFPFKWRRYPAVLFSRNGQ